MYICLCNQITDSDIEQAITNGQACCISDLQQQLGLADCCGACQLEAKRLLEDLLAKQSTNLE